MSTMLDWSLFYRAQGLSVFPVQAKLPLVPWKKYQEEQPSEEETRAHFTRYPEADIGCATGERWNLLVLDIDGEEGKKSIESLPLGDTKATQTRRGNQYYFKFPRGFSGKSTLAGIMPGVDVRGNGGLVILPPSQFSDGSGRYSWINDGEIAECPQWLLDKLVEVNKPREINRDSNDSWLKEKLDGLKEGNRNATFTAIAGSLRSRGYSSDDIYRILEPHTIQGSFPVEELRTICESVGQYSPRTQVNTEAQSISEFLQDEQKVEWIVPGIIAKRSIGFIAGLPETSKTFLTMDLGIECSNGGGLWLGKFPVNAGKVLFVDQERFKGETQRRLKSLISAKGIQPGMLKDSLRVKCGTTIRLNLQNSFEAFRKELLEIKPDLVIIDSFATFHTATENDRTEIQKVLELIKSLRDEIGCTFMFINHEGKSVLHHEPGEVKTPNAADMMGSTAIPAAAELVLTVRRKDSDSCMVYCTKNTLAQKIEPFSVSVVDVEDGIKVIGN